MLTPEHSLSARPDRLVRAMIPNGRDKGFCAFTFHASEVLGVMELPAGRAALLLRSGMTIPAALSYETLEEKVFASNFRADGPVLDLREVTGEVARDPRGNAPTEPHIGAVMPDGTVYAGLSPDTNSEMYAMPEDEISLNDFNGARGEARKCTAHGHADWRVPSRGELRELFNNRAAIGEFHLQDSGDYGCYRSSTPAHIGTAYSLHFNTGQEEAPYKSKGLAVRYIRG